MAQVRPIFQPVMAGNQHVNQFTSLVGEPWATDFLLSSAFSNLAGVKAVSAAVAPISGQCRIFIGVRNGSTTAQSLAALLRLGVDLYGVDTATRSRIFHPKLYLARGGNRSRAIIGSANLTHAGLFNNIEAGADIDLDLTDQCDTDFLDAFLSGFKDLVVNHPDHCFPITSGRQIIDLMRQGLLEEERNPETQTALGAGKQGAKTIKPPIGLPLTAPQKNIKIRKPKPPAAAAAGGTASAPPTYGQLVWVKPKLPATDLKLNPAHPVSGGKVNARCRLLALSSRSPRLRV